MVYFSMYFIPLNFIYCVYVHPCHKMHAEIRGWLMKFNPLLPPCGVGNWNQGSKPDSWYLNLLSHLVGFLGTYKYYFISIPSWFVWVFVKMILTFPQENATSFKALFYWSIFLFTCIVFSMILSTSTWFLLVFII